MERIRKRFVMDGSERALNEDPRPGQTRKLDGREEATLIATACTDAPEGHAHWSLQLLAEKLVQLGVVEAVSYETGAAHSKKNKLKPWQQEMWCIPEASAEYVACMEDVLDLYEQPYDPKRPQVFYDEWRRALIGETRKNLPAEPGSVSALITSIGAMALPTCTCCLNP